MQTLQIKQLSPNATLPTRTHTTDAYEGEKWVTVEGFPKHKISTLGRLKSFGVKKEGVISEGWIEKDGYRRHILRYRDKVKYITAHRLVALNFLEKDDVTNLQVNHIDGNKLNNNVDNLEWCTLEENIKHAFEIGLRNSTGTNNPKAKLTENEVREIRKLYKNKKKNALELSKIYGVSRTNIYSIVNNKIWKEVI